jgi:diacylglycerol kinase family enzyme
MRTLRSAFGVTPVRTEGRGHATLLAREAAEAGYDVVAVVGGDGTVSEAAAGVVGTPTALACLPAGCTDVFARSIGTERRALVAAERLMSAALEQRLAPRTVDVGTVNGRPFVSTSGVGLSASMTATAETEQARKARFGQLHFAGAAVSELATRYLRRPPRMRVHAAGRTAEGITLMVQNSHALTYFGARQIRVCNAAGLDTGAISLTLLRGARPRDVPSVLLRLLSGRGVADHPQIDAFPLLREACVISADGRPLPVEADGEFLGEHHRVEYGVAPGALRVV